MIFLLPIDSVELLVKVVDEFRDPANGYDAETAASGIAGCDAAIKAIKTKTGQRKITGTAQISAR